MNWIIVIFCLGVLIALHEGGHYLLARMVGMKVLRYSIGFFKPVFSHTSARTGISYQIGSVPLGGFVEVKGMNPFEEGALEDPDSYQMKPVWQRALVIVAGPLANLLLAWFILFAVVAFAGLPTEVNEAGIGQVEKGGPADRAGLRKGDRVVSLNGTPLRTFDALAALLHENPDRRVQLLISRDGRRLPVEVTPQNVDGIGLIGIYPPTELVSLPPLQAAVFATDRCIGVLGDTLSALGGMIAGTQKDVKPVGPPGIVKMGKTHLDSGPIDFLAFMAYISLMLFLFNLLPIPALDGGRTVFLLYEVVSGRRVNRKVDAVVNYVFFFLLMGLIAVISIKELVFG